MHQLGEGVFALLPAGAENAGQYLMRAGTLAVRLPPQFLRAIAISRMARSARLLVACKPGRRRTSTTPRLLASKARSGLGRATGGGGSAGKILLRCNITHVIEVQHIGWAARLLRMCNTA